MAMFVPREDREHALALYQSGELQLGGQFIGSAGDMYTLREVHRWQVKSTGDWVLKLTVAKELSFSFVMDEAPRGVAE